MDIHRNFSVLYENDFSTITFKDGSTLQLAACGSSFLFSNSTKKEHTIHGSRHVQQRTKFATSLFKRQVQAALQFRNTYAEQPYICTEMTLAEQLQHLPADIDSVTWSTGSQLQADGTIVVTSVQKWAELALAPCRQYFSVWYLAHMSRKSKGVMTDGVSTSWQYCWQQQRHSVTRCPPLWAYPLSLGIEPHPTIPSTNPSQGVYAGQMGIPGQGHCPCVHTVVPASLPVTCSAPHLHYWQQDLLIEEVNNLLFTCHQNGRIKVIETMGDVYRFYWSQPPELHVYLKDGSMLCSSGIYGHFFTHYLYQNNKVEERSYSTSHLPPDSSPLHKVLARATRFLMYLSEDTIDLGCTSCWKRSLTNVVKPDLQPLAVLECCTVPDVAEFRAYTNGHIRVLFSDRTSLDTWADFSKRLQDNVRVVRGELVPGISRLMLPNGHYEHVINSRPQQYARYIKAAEEWIRWVNSSPSERRHFYADTMYDPEKASHVELQLQKIKCFNFLLENSALGEFLPPSSQETRAPAIPTTQMEFSLDSVQAALKNISETVAQLDSFLSKTSTE